MLEPVTPAITASPFRPLRGSVLHVRSTLLILPDPASKSRPSTSWNPRASSFTTPRTEPAAPITRDLWQPRVSCDAVDLGHVSTATSRDTMLHSHNSGHFLCRCISRRPTCRLNAQEQSPQSLPDWTATANASKEPRPLWSMRKSRKFLLT